MNIFKILANGDGTINEANISAFLGYLLDPYENHGLGYEFLDSFIDQIEFLDEEEFTASNYEFKIFLEQAFRKNNGPKKIVDIVIMCFHSNKGKGREDLVVNVIRERNLKYIFLIENKILSIKKNNEQLQEQYDSTIDTLKINDTSQVVSVFITPKQQNFNEVFNKLNIERKKHFLWNDIDGNISILSLIKEIIENESIGKREPINEYTKHTLKSFIQFVDNDFKSEKKEVRELKNSRDITYSLDEFINKFSYSLNPYSSKIVHEFTTYINNNYPNLQTRHSKTHSCTILLNGKKIFSLTRISKGIEPRLITRNYKFNAEQLLEIKYKLDELNLDTQYNSINHYGFLIKNKDLHIDKIIKIFNIHLNYINQNNKSNNAISESDY